VVFDTFIVVGEGIEYGQTSPVKFLYQQSDDFTVLIPLPDGVDWWTPRCINSLVPRSSGLWVHITVLKPGTRWKWMVDPTVNSQFSALIMSAMRSQFLTLAPDGCNWRTTRFLHHQSDEVTVLNSGTRWRNWWSPRCIKCLEPRSSERWFHSSYPATRWRWLVDPTVH
jgi:hypothetical protein